jgi:uncharacterized protein (TIGR02594 family)
MSQVTRENFVTSGTRLDLKDLDEGDRAALARAGLDPAALARMAGQDGIIEGKAELDQLFLAIDHLDHDGSYQSIATTTKNQKGEEVATASGKALAALQTEVAEARLSHQLAGPKPPPAPPKPPAPAAPPKPAAAPSTTAAGAPRADQALPSDPEYLKTAFGEVGVKEGKGEKTTKRILEYFEATYQRKGEKGEHTDDSGRENAWCGAFLTWSLKQDKIKAGGAVGAREFEKFGEASEPFRGAIVVLQHGKQKHVAILVGVDKQGNNVYLGGNQGNQVRVSTLPGYEILAVRKPPGHVVTPESKVLPQIDATAAKGVT